MNPSRGSMQILVSLATLALSGTATLEDYTVHKGQTVSFIAFQKYGAYSDSIAALLKADNPQIADLDMVAVGQILHLRKDEKAPVGLEKDPDRRVLMASRKAVVTMTQGSGEIRRAKGGREPLAANRFLSTGDSIVTGSDGLAEIIVDNQSVLRLAPGTEVRLTAIQEPQKPSSTDKRALATRFSLLRGKTWTMVQKWAGSRIAFQVQMPNAIAGVHGTVFENAIAEDSTSSVSVYRGEVGVEGGSDQATTHKSLAPTQVAGPKEISMGQWIKILKDNQRLSISKTGAAGQSVQFKPDSASAWVKLNQERDSLCD
jgi:hypothetical protein